MQVHGLEEEERVWNMEDWNNEGYSVVCSPNGWTVIGTAKIYGSRLRRGANRHKEPFTSNMLVSYFSGVTDDLQTESFFLNCAFLPAKAGFSLRYNLNPLSAGQV